MGHVAAARGGRHPARRAAERRHLPQAAVDAARGRHVVDERARVGHPARLQVVGRVARHLQRGAARQETDEDLALAARDGHERHHLAVRRDGRRRRGAGGVREPQHADVGAALPSNAAAVRAGAGSELLVELELASPMSRRRARGSFSRQRRSSRRTAAGVPPAGASSRARARAPARACRRSSRRRTRGAPVEHLEEHAAERPDVRAPVDGSPRACSGLMYAGGAEDHARAACPAEVSVGDCDDVGLGARRSAHAPWRARSRAPSRRPSGVTLTLAGLRSRWTMPCSCAASSAVGDLPRDGERLGRAAAGRCGEALVRASSPSTSSSTSARRAVGVLDAVDRRDVRVVERREQARLALEAREPLGIGARTRAGSTLIATSRPSRVSRAR